MDKVTPQTWFTYAFLLASGLVGAFFAAGGASKKVSSSPFSVALMMVSMSSGNLALSPTSMACLSFCNSMDLLFTFISR